MKLKAWSIGCVATGIVVGVVGFILPPLGQIDGSVLTFVGECIGAAGLMIFLYAIDKGVASEWKHGNTSVTMTPDVNKGKK